MSLRHAVSVAVRWTAVTNALVGLIQLAGFVVLARLLAPADFGVLAMIVVVIGLADMLSQLGIGESIVQHQGTPTGGQLSTLFWANLALGAVAYALVVLAMPAIDWVYGEPRLGEVLPVAALSLLVSPLGLHVAAMLRRSLRFGAASLVDMVKALLGACVSVLLAVQGFGVWALVVGQLVSAAAGAAMLLAIGAQEGWFPRLQWTYREARGFLTFGGFFFASNLVNFVNARIDQLLIGSLLGSQALGYYALAFNLVIQPVSRINPVITQIAFPVLSSIRGDRQRLQRSYLKMLNVLGSVNAPLLIGLAAVAPLAVPLLVGEQWLPAVPIVQILAGYSLLRSAGNAGGTLIYAEGRPDWAFAWNVALACMIPPAVFVGARVGALTGVAWALLLVQGGLFVLWYPGVVVRILGSCFRRYLESFLIPTAIAGGMGAIVLALGELLIGWNRLPALTLLVLAGSCIYLCAYYTFCRRELKEYISLILHTTP